MKKLNIGIIREGKIPSDSRAPLSPQQCRQLLDQHSQIAIFVQPSPHRCYADDEYSSIGIPMQDDLSHCDILMGVKEVPVDQLLPEKKYLFFSHTIKEQPYNQKLMWALLDKGIQMIDYECLVDDQYKRILGFGHFAGVVGAHNGLLAYGRKTATFDLKPAYLCKDFAEIKQHYAQLQLPPIKIVLTGNGRVSTGAKEVLDILQIQEVSPHDFLHQEYPHPVYTQLVSKDLYRHCSTNKYDRNDFHAHPDQYRSSFAPYTRVTDLMMNGVYWAADCPPFFTKDEMKAADFCIKVIADISCDIEGSIPATLRATRIGDPVMGYNPHTEQEEAPYQAHTIDIMAVDNLPNELPRDATEQFGAALSRYIIPELLQPNSTVIDRATITLQGKLHGRFQYLEHYAAKPTYHIS